MDPLSITAGIIAIIQLSSDVVDYLSDAAGATSERMHLCDEILECEFILKRLKVKVDNSDKQKSWSNTVNALNEGPSAPLNRLLVALSTVKVKVEPKKGVKRVLAPLKWHFDKKEVEEAISTIERLKRLLNLALTNDCGYIRPLYSFQPKQPGRLQFIDMHPENRID